MEEVIKLIESYQNGLLSKEEFLVMLQKYNQVEIQINGN